MKLIILSIAIFFLLFTLQSNSQVTFHDLSAKTIDGDTISMSIFKGKKLLVVNTASLCGYTYQYGELQSLYEQYGGNNFEIIGFPSNDFSEQEPGTDSTIAEFCEKNYGVTFTMMSKIAVTGTKMHPIYKWLTQKSQNEVGNSTVQWNFQKYMVDEDGKLVDVVGTTSSPLISKITDWLKTTSVEEESPAFKSIRITPNPSPNSLRITMNNSNVTNGSIAIYGTSGVKVLNVYSGNISSNQEFLVDISVLPIGTYHLIYESGNSRFSEKFVKSN